MPQIFHYTNALRFRLVASAFKLYFVVGNQLRFHSAGACAVIVTAIKTHGMDPFTAEYGFRAIYNLSAENANVSELGSKGACGLVVAGLKKHLDHPKVLTQACFATYGLAVKVKSDKVHTGNTRKLVEKVSNRKWVVVEFSSCCYVCFQITVIMI